MLDDLADLLVGNAPGARRVDGHVHRLRDADRVRELHLALLRETGGHDVLRDVARRVRRRAVDLRRILARERAAPVRRRAAVRVDDDLAAREAGVAVRPADLEAAGRVDQETRVREHLARQHRLDDLLDHRLGELGLPLVHARVVLRRQHDRVDRDRVPVVVADGDLGLRVGSEERQPAVAAHLALPLDQPVRVVDRERHQRRRLVAGVAEHHPLVAGALVQVVVGGLVDAALDVGRLLAVADHDRAAVGVEAQRGVVVADVPDRLARDVAEVDDRLRRDLAGHDDEAGRHQRLRGHAGRGVLL